VVRRRAGQAARHQVGNDWRSHSDQIGRFVHEACVKGEVAQAMARQLYQAYRNWAEEVGETPTQERDFAHRIEALGFTDKHIESGKLYLGIGLRVAG
jgi:putative DNA primase/helicase